MIKWIKKESLKTEIFILVFIEEYQEYFIKKHYSLVKLIVKKRKSTPPPPPQKKSPIDIYNVYIEYRLVSSKKYFWKKKGFMCSVVYKMI